MDEIVEPPPINRDRTRETSPIYAPPTRRGYGRVIFWVLLIGIVGGGYWWWTHHKAQPARTVGQGGGRFAQSVAQPVGFATVDKGDIRIVLNALGTVTSLDTVMVFTQISGQLQEVGFQEGQVVHKGDFLIQIDPRPFQAAVEQAEGTLAKDTGLLQQAQADLKRFQTLGRQDSIAMQQLDDQRYLVMQDTGQVRTDQGALDTAKLNLAYCRIVSPIDGQVGLRQVDPGNYVQASTTTALVAITQMEPISVLFSVPEDDLPAIMKQVKADNTLSVQAYDRANVNLLATGHLATMDNLIDTTTGTLKLRAIFDNPDHLLYPNQFVNARLLVNTLKQTVRVPVSAVQTGAPGTFVYLINANNTVSVKTIKVGPVDGQFQAVTSGLEPGDRVVTDGTDRLRDGAQVTLPAAKNGQQANGHKGGTGETQAAGAPTSGAPASGEEDKGEGEKGKGERHRHRESSTPSAE